MGGAALYEEVMEAAKWMHNAPDSGSATLTHQLLCDVARCVYRQVLLLHLKVSDPVTGRPSVALRHPTADSYLIPTAKLIETAPPPSGGTLEKLRTGKEDSKREWTLRVARPLRFGGDESEIRFRKTIVVLITSSFTRSTGGTAESVTQP